VSAKPNSNVSSGLKIRENHDWKSAGKISVKSPQSQPDLSGYQVFKYSLSLSQSIETDNYTVVNPVAPCWRFLATAQPVNGRFEMREEKL
jgi:hypothetical protein